MRFRTVVSVCLLAAGAACSDPQQNAAARHTDDAPSLSRAKTGQATVRRIAISGTRYLIFTADLLTMNVSIHLRNRNTQFFTLEMLRQYLGSHGDDVLMLTNAGMFMEDWRPVGFLYADSGRSRFPLNVSQGTGQDNFHMMPNGVFWIDSGNVPHIDTTGSFSRRLLKGIALKCGTQSGPMLVINGRIHHMFTPASKNLNIRSGVGVADAHTVMFAISEQPCIFYDFAILFRDSLHCNNALYLDGFISLMYVNGINTTTQAGRFGPMISVTSKTLK